MLLQAESDRSCTFSRASGHSGRRGSSPGSHLLHLPLPAPGSPTCGGAQPGFKGLKTLQPAPHMSPGRALLRTCPEALYKQLRQPLGDGGEPVFPPKRTSFFFFPKTPLSPGTSSPGSQPPVDTRGRFGVSRWAATPASHGAASPQPPHPPLTATEPEEEATKTRITIFTSSAATAGTRGRDGAGHRLRRLLPPSLLRLPLRRAGGRERREAGRWGRSAGAAGRCSPAACVVLGKCGVRKPAPSAKCRHPCVKVCRRACTVPLVCCLLAPQHHRCRVRGAQDA